MSFKPETVWLITWCGGVVEINGRDWGITRIWLGSELERALRCSVAAEIRNRCVSPVKEQSAIWVKFVCWVVLFCCCFCFLFLVFWLMFFFLVAVFVLFFVFLFFFFFFFFFLFFFFLCVIVFVLFFIALLLFFPFDCSFFVFVFFACFLFHARLRFNNVPSGVE